MDANSTSQVTEDFDVSLEGTPELHWRALLGKSPFVTGPPNSLLIVAPHPDDETLGSGGLIHFCNQAQRPIRLISVTQGEAAWPGVSGLSGLRARELQHALACLTSEPIEVCRLLLPDGLVTSHEDRLYQAIDDRLNDDDTLVAPFEKDGHPDHDTVGRVCLNIAHRRGVSLLRYPIWGWHRLKADAFQSSSFIRVALSQQAQSAKARAIRCFATQLQGYEGRSPILQPHFLRYFARPYEAFLKCQMS